MLETQLAESALFRSYLQVNYFLDIDVKWGEVRVISILTLQDDLLCDAIKEQPVLGVGSIIHCQHAYIQNLSKYTAMITRHYAV